MSTNLGEAIGYIKLDTSGFESSLTSIEKNLNSTMSNMEKSMSSFDKGVSALKTTFSSLSKMVGLGGFVALATTLVKAGKEVVNLESKLTDMRATLGLTADEIERIYDASVALGAGGIRSASEYVAAFEQLAQRGYSVADSLSYIDTIDKAALVSQRSLAETIEQTTQSLKGYGLGMADLAGYYDSLLFVSQNSGLTIKELENNLSSLSTVATATGNSYQTILQALSASDAAGLSAQKTMTGLNMVLSTLSSASSTTVGHFSEIGVSLYDAEGQMKDIITLTQEVAAAFESMGASSTEISNWAFATGGVRGGQVLLSLINANTEAFEGLGAAASGAGGLLDEAASVMEGSLSYILSDIKGKLTSLATIILKTMTPAFESFLKVIQSVVTGVSNFFLALSKTEGLIRLGSSLSSLIDSFKTLFSYLKGDSDITIFESIAQAVDKVSEYIGVVIDACSAAVSVFLSVLQGDWEAAFSGLTGIVQTVFGYIYKTIKDALTQVANVIGSFLSPVYDVWASVWGNVSDFFANVWNFIGNTLTTVVNKIISIFSSLVNGVATVIGAFDFLPVVGDNLDETSTKLKNWSDNLSKTWVDVKGTIEKGVVGVTSNIVDAITSGFSAVDNWLLEPFEGVEETVEGISESLEGLVEVVDEVAEAVDDLDLEEAVGSVPSLSPWKKFTSSLKSEFENVTKSAQSITSALSTTIGYVSGIIDDIFAYNDQLLEQQLSEVQSQMDELNALYEEQVQAVQDGYDEELKALKKQLASGEISAKEYNEKRYQLEQQYNSQLDALNDEKIASEEALKKEEDELAKKQFEANKTNQITQVWLNAAAAIMMTFATSGWLLGLIFSALILAQAAIQSATISASKYVSAFAKGGIIDSPTLALMGEAGREAVVPLEHNTEWMDVLADTLRNDGVGGGYSVTINSAVKLNASQTAKQVKRALGEFAYGL